MKTLTILHDNFYDRSEFRIDGKFYAQLSGGEINTEFWVKLVKQLGTTVVQKDRDLVGE